MDFAALNRTVPHGRLCGGRRVPSFRAQGTGTVERLCSLTI